MVCNAVGVYPANPHPAYRTTTPIGTVVVENWRRALSIRSMRPRLSVGISNTFDRSKLRGAFATANREIIVEIKVLAVKARRDVSGLLAALQFPVISRKNLLLDLPSAVGVNRVGNVGVKLQAGSVCVSVAMLEVSVGIEPVPALITKFCTKMVLLCAFRAVIGDFPGRHRQKKIVISVDQFHVANNERVVKSK